MTRAESERQIEIVIDLTGQDDKAQRVYDAVETTLHDMGEIGTLSMRTCARRPANKILDGLRSAKLAVEITNAVLGVLPADIVTRDLQKQILVAISPLVPSPSSEDAHSPGAGERE